MAHYRRSQGLKATSINIGVVLDVGYAAEQEKVSQYLKAFSFIGIRSQDVIAIVQAAIADQLPAQVTIGLPSGGLLKQNGSHEPYWFAESRFNPLRICDTQEFAVSTNNPSLDIRTTLAEAKSMQEATDAISLALKQKLANMMLMEVDDINVDRPAHSFGVDSLVAVEFRAWAFRELVSDISVFDILSNAPLYVLAGKIAAKSTLVAQNVPT